MKLTITILTAKGTWALLPLLGLIVTTQSDCSQGLAAAAIALVLYKIIAGPISPVPIPHW
jgi:hypothetical protein